MVILRYCYGMSRRNAGLLPRWERDLLIRAGEDILGVGDESEGRANAAKAGLTPTEYNALLGAGG